MTRHVGLLRAVNVAGHQQVAMVDLRQLLAQLGFSEPRSLLQSGNLVFGSRVADAAAVERVLEAELDRRLGLRTALFVRSAAEWTKIIQRNPFPAEAARDPGRLVVMFLKEAPGRTAVAALQDALTGPEIVRAEGRQVYIVYPAGIGRSRLTGTVIERKLGTRGTGRNWNTVLKIGTLVGG